METLLNLTDHKVWEWIFRGAFMLQILIIKGYVKLVLNKVMQPGYRHYYVNNDEPYLYEFYCNKN
jgi:hypothetical protein